MARQPSGPGIQRDHTVQGQWTGAVLQDFHACSSRDPEELEFWTTTPHRHLFIVRPVVPVCVTGTRIACDEWVGSNHYEGMTGPKKDVFSARRSMHRPWSRGFVWQPKGVPRIIRNVFDRQLTAGVDRG